MTAPSWTSHSPYPGDVDGPAAAAPDPANGRFYLFGGGLTGTTASYEYDPVSDTWTAKAPVPTAHDWPAAASPGGGRIHVIGGCSTDKHEAYDTATNTWTTKADHPSVGGSCQSGACAVDGIIHVFGNSQGGTAHLAYDPSSNTWTTRAAMPYHSRHRVSALVIGGEVWVVVAPYLSNDDVEVVLLQRYRPVDDDWIFEGFGPERHRQGEPAAGTTDGSAIWIMSTVGNGRMDAFVPGSRSWLVPDPQMPVTPAITTPVTVTAPSGRLHVLTRVYGANPGGSWHLSMAADTVESPVDGVVIWPDGQWHGVRRGRRYAAPASGVATFIG